MEQAPPTSLGKKSVFWAAAETGGTAALTILAMLLMARMMMPADFGTAALVIGGVQFLNLYVEGLFHDGLIQNPDTDDEKFETALSLVQIVAAVIIAIGIVVAFALRASSWSTAAWLFVAASLSLPFSGALGVANARMRRDLIFREVARASLTGRVVGSVLGLVLAYFGLGAWSLVWQFTCIAALQAAMLYLQSGWRPRRRGNFRVLWPIARFAVPYAAMHSLVALRLQGFLMLVAAQMGLTDAGIVNVAFRLTTTPQIVLTTAFTNLGLPLLAQHQRSAARMAEAFRFLSQMVMWTAIPAFVGLALSAQELVPIMLGERWLAVIPLVQVLSIGVAVGFLRFPASTVLRALGNVRYSFASSSFQLVFTLGGLLLLPATLQIAVWLWVLPAVLQLPLAVLAVVRESAISLRVWVRSLLPALLATVIMAIVVTLVGDALRADGAAYRLVAKITSGAATAMVILLAVDGRSRAVIMQMLWKRRGAG